MANSITLVRKVFVDIYENGKREERFGYSFSDRNAGVDFDGFDGMETLMSHSPEELVKHARGIGPIAEGLLNFAAECDKPILIDDVAVFVDFGGVTRVCDPPPPATIV